MKSICVFAGSRPGSRTEYLAAATSLGQELARRDLTVIYGGGSVGLMEALAGATLAADGRVIGVIPEALLAQGRGREELTEQHVVRTMHERKARMAELADGFVALPGGFGTLEEICEMLTWNQLGFQQKPCGILDVGGYFDSLAAFLDRAVAEEFLQPKHRTLLLRSEDPGELIDKMREFPVDTGTDPYSHA